MSRIGVIELLIIGLCGLIVMLAIVILVVVLIIASNKKRAQPASAPDRTPDSTSGPPTEAAAMEPGPVEMARSPQPDPLPPDPEPKS
jgi:hypothetical protein